MNIIYIFVNAYFLTLKNSIMQYRHQSVTNQDILGQVMLMIVFQIINNVYKIPSLLHLKNHFEIN